MRLWIELLKNAYYKNSTELETLPNIDINIKCGNSLVSRFAIDADLSYALKKSKWSIGSYRIAVDTYRNAESKEQKREMERLILEIKQNFSSEIRMNDPVKKRLDKIASELYHRFTGTFLFEPDTPYGKEKKNFEKRRKGEQKKLENEIEVLNAKIEDIKANKIFENAFEWRFEFPEVLNDVGDFVGFDVVIGNPPYFSLSKVKEQSEYFSNANYQTYSKGADIYCLFYELGGNILKPFGYLTYITSNSWLRAIYGELLKKYFIGTLQPIALINIEDVQIFEEATVESNIITLQKAVGSNSFPIVNLGKDYIPGDSISEYFYKNNFEFSPSSNPEWFIGKQSVGILKSKIENGARLLKDFNVRINFGIKTGYNEAFIIDENKRNELIKTDSKNTEIIKPIIRGRDLKKYAYEFSNLYVIKSLYKENEFLKQEYPKIVEYLTLHFEKLSKRGQVTNGQHHWLELDNNPTQSYFDLFEKPKIVWGEISDKPKFTFDDNKFFAEATTFLMTGEKLKFLLAILNSKISEWYFNLIGTTTGMGTNRWKKYKIELLPIKVPSIEQEKRFEILVNQILAVKKQLSTADTSNLENQIDQLVYQLYDLTEDEIKIIESN